MTRNSLAWSRSSWSPSARRCAMNSSVTFDRAISVTSSLCLPISCSSRSNGPSKFASRTVKRPGAAPSAPGAVGAAPVSLLTDAETMRTASVALQSSHQHRVVAALLEVGEQHPDRLADDAPPVGRHTVPAAQRHPRRLQGEQFVGRDVDRDLLVVLGPVGALRGTTPGRHVRLQRRGRLRGRAEPGEVVTGGRVGRAARHQGERHGRLRLGRLLRAARRRAAPQRRRARRGAQARQLGDLGSGRSGVGAAEELRRTRQNGPPGHRASTSLARSRYAEAPDDVGAHVVIGCPATVVSGNRTVRWMTVWNTTSSKASTTRVNTSRQCTVRVSYIVARIPEISSDGFSRSLTLSIVSTSRATPRREKYSHSSGMITPWAAVSALTVSSPRDGWQSMRM